MIWATFLAVLSQTHLVTLATVETNSLAAWLCGHRIRLKSRRSAFESRFGAMKT
jgi:hypothetical protein